MATSSILPPSFHYGIVLPAIKDQDQAAQFLLAYSELMWAVRFLFNELRFKDGSLHSPQFYRHFQDQLIELERYIQDLEELIETLPLHLEQE